MGRYFFFASLFWIGSICTSLGWQTNCRFCVKLKFKAGTNLRFSFQADVPVGLRGCSRLRCQLTGWSSLVPDWPLWHMKPVQTVWRRWCIQPAYISVIILHLGEMQAWINQGWKKQKTNTVQSRKVFFCFFFPFLFQTQSSVLPLHFFLPAY